MWCDGGERNDHVTNKYRIRIKFCLIFLPDCFEFLWNAIWLAIRAGDLSSRTRVPCLGGPGTAGIAQAHNVGKIMTLTTDTVQTCLNVFKSHSPMFSRTFLTIFVLHIQLVDRWRLVVSDRRFDNFIICPDAAILIASRSRPRLCL